MKHPEQKTTKNNHSDKQKKDRRRPVAAPPSAPLVDLALGNAAPDAAARAAEEVVEGTWALPPEGGEVRSEGC